MKYGKWIGGIAGWAVGGPIGAIIGAAVGSIFDNTPSETAQERAQRRAGYRDPRNRYRTSPADFAKALVILSAAVMKADGKVLKSELNYVKDYFTRAFGEAQAKELILVLKEVLKEDIQLRAVCDQIRYHMEHASRLQLLHYLHGIAQADGHYDDAEKRLLHQIASYLGISFKDEESVSNMYQNNLEAAYKILEISDQATDQEVKKAYRKMAIKYHPDKLAHLGPEHQKNAKEKFIKVQEAYERICKQRGIK
ncbi:TerB family tellurite resistance protein [Luteibaculum oceani]|uniref:Molecular chaperone DjiA n=1 Tax=Luteibaculum oceani TaxID=1294296 RepID=A0A5C6VAV4_9FLAO|nr:TerB family tellurite resistance protein [Luteibaculum oceani]TXC81964.1 molecular chaperone DjiA [Luteibaculum oceani]